MRKEFETVKKINEKLELEIKMESPMCFKPVILISNVFIYKKILVLNCWNSSDI